VDPRKAGDIERQDGVKRFRRFVPLSVAAAVVAILGAPSLLGQANISSTKQPELTSLSPALKKAVDEVQKQCPTCATIDLARGKETWVLGGGVQVRSQIANISDGCELASSAKAQSIALRATLNKAFTGDDLTSFMPTFQRIASRRYSCTTSASCGKCS
jgi:hypothetical protein